ncbi:tyrosine-type recombinase/integrase [Sulfurovum sp. CS9]|uniref:tyrosine-type recombinase/integrase n=1 Tax=Sulfurovum sp. CS9 TaxID=3391146 RepID=UPI0039EAE21C
MARIKSNKYAGVYLNHLVSGDISYSINYKNHNSKKVWVTIGKKSNGVNEKFANTKRAEYVNKVKTGADPLEHKKKKEIVSLNHLANVYFDDKADENKTNDRQKGKYKLHIKPVLGSKDIQAVTKDDVVKLQKSLKAKDKAPKTVNGAITLLKAIINHSIKEKDLKLINPCIGVKPLKEDDKRERYLTIDEVKKVIESVQGNEILYHFVKMALTTGARLESVLHMQKKDINLNNNSVTITDLKSGGTYTAFYDDDYKDKIESYTKQLKLNDYFIGGKAEPIPGRTMRRWLKPKLDELFNVGLEIDDAKNRVVIHTLRHTFASQLAIAGVPILTIKTLMNHADIAQTMRYAKLAPDQGSEAVKGLYR